MQITLVEYNIHIFITIVLATDWTLYMPVSVNLVNRNCSIPSNYPGFAGIILVIKGESRHPGFVRKIPGFRAGGSRGVKERALS